MLPSDPGQPADILSQFKVQTISHIKMPMSPEHEFLVIETVDQSDKPYLFILERRPSETRTGVTPVVDSSTYRTRLVDKLKKLIKTMTNFIVPIESHLMSNKEGFSSSSSSSFAFDSLSIGDKATLSLIQTSDLMSDSLEKSDNTLAIDRFLGQNYLRSTRYHGQIVGYFKPHLLTLFDLVLLAHVVHEMYPTYTLLGQQCFFYARLVYASIQKIFGISPLKSADENGCLVYSIDSHLTVTFKYGRWKGILVNLIDEDTVSKVSDAYAVAYSDQVAKVFFIYL